ncbi:hypothetical protein M9H77_04556 [Catharanthus roseus]|uniref:Uncharacterized protein n=1 Tax=Catharanthus roseus TaxID=4058 RepID=A0ACC0CEU2_CATRO|nr:hypothetical protein M9H77_04556 [Catharanthus roseus]
MLKTEEDSSSGSMTQLMEMIASLQASMNSQFDNLDGKISNIQEKGDVNPNTFEEFLESEEFVDHGNLFTTNRIFNSKVELVDWAKERAMKANTYLIINRYMKSRTSDHRPYVTLVYERGGAVKKNMKPIVDDEEEKVPIKSRGVLTGLKNVVVHLN